MAALTVVTDFRAWFSVKLLKSISGKPDRRGKIGLKLRISDKRQSGPGIYPGPLCYSCCSRRIKCFFLVEIRPSFCIFPSSLDRALLSTFR